MKNRKGKNGTRQLTDQSSTSHPSSPPSPSPVTGTRSRTSSAQGSSEEDQSLHLLKQYYLDCILRIDPNHPVGQKFSRVRRKFDEILLLHCYLGQRWSRQSQAQRQIKKTWSCEESRVQEGETISQGFILFENFVQSLFFRCILHQELRTCGCGVRLII